MWCLLREKREAPETWLSLIPSIKTAKRLLTQLSRVSQHAYVVSCITHEDTAGAVYPDQFVVSPYLTLDRRRWVYPCPETEILVQVAGNPGCAGVRETKYHETSLWHPTWPCPTLMYARICWSLSLSLSLSFSCLLTSFPLCVHLPVALPVPVCDSICLSRCIRLCVTEWRTHGLQVNWKEEMQMGLIGGPSDSGSF